MFEIERVQSVTRNLNSSAENFYRSVGLTNSGRANPLGRMSQGSAITYHFVCVVKQQAARLDPGSVQHGAELHMIHFSKNGTSQSFSFRVPNWSELNFCKLILHPKLPRLKQSQLCRSCSIRKKMVEIRNYNRYSKTTVQEFVRYCLNRMLQHKF